MQQGTQNVANQINSFNQRCPNSKLVIVGYSQVCPRKYLLKSLNHYDAAPD